MPNIARIVQAPMQWLRAVVEGVERVWLYLVVERSYCWSCHFLAEILRWGGDAFTLGLWSGSRVSKDLRWVNKFN